MPEDALSLFQRFAAGELASRGQVADVSSTQSVDPDEWDEDNVVFWHLPIEPASDEEEEHNNRLSNQLTMG
jgi:hypothetical protein